MIIGVESTDLNNILMDENHHIALMLSEKGKGMFFPKGGILQQTAEARGTAINATIGQAFESDGSPMVLESLAGQVKSNPKDSFLYSPSYGNKDLREAWKREIRRKNPSLKSAISTPIVASGLTHGLYVVGKLFVQPHESIISPDRFWENYELTFDGVKLDTFPAFQGERFNIDGLASKLLAEREKKKVVLLNFPNNPAGYTPTREEAEKIRDIIQQSAKKGNRIVAICDDAYFGLVYEEGIERESIFSKLAGLDERVLTIKVDGISKEMYAWGLRVGFVTYGFRGINDSTASVLEKKTAGAIRGTISTASTLSQTLALNALKSSAFFSEMEGKFEELKKRYEAVKDSLKSHPEYLENFEALPFNSGYFMCVKLKGADPEKVRRRLISDYNTGVVVNKDIMRVAYSSVGKDSIPAIFHNINEAVKKEKAFEKF